MHDSPGDGFFQVALGGQVSQQLNPADLEVGTWCAEVGNEVSCTRRRRGYKSKGKDLKKKEKSHEFLWQPGTLSARLRSPG